MEPPKPQRRLGKENGAQGRQVQQRSHRRRWMEAETLHGQRQGRRRERRSGL